MSIFIQEVLNLLQRNKSKESLNLKTDYFEFGRKGASTLNTGTSYAPSMDPYVIKAQDFVCTVTEGLTRTVAGSGTVDVFPIYAVTDGVCSLKALKDSVISLVGDTVTVDVNNKFTANWIKLGKALEADGSTGTVGQVLTVAASGIPVWSTGGAGVSYTFTGAVSNTTDYAISLQGDDGTLQKVSLIAGTNITLTDNSANGVTIDAAGGGTMSKWSIDDGGAGGFTVANNDAVMVSGSSKITVATDAASKSISWTHKDTKRVDSTSSVTPNPGDTFTVIDSITQDVTGHTTEVNVKTVKLPIGGGGGTVTGTGTTNHMTMWTGSTSIGIAAPVSMIQSVVGATDVLTVGSDSDSQIVQFESTVDLQGSLKDSTSTLGTLGQVLSATSTGLVEWKTLSGSGTVTTVSSTVAGDAIAVAVTDPTTTPALAFSFSGNAEQYINGLGNLVDSPFPYDLTSLTDPIDSTRQQIKLTGSGGSAVDIVTLVAGTNVTLSAPGANSIAIDVADAAVTSLTTTGTSGAATLAAGVLNIPDYAVGGGGSVTAVNYTSDIAAFTASVTNGTTQPLLELNLNGGTAGQFLQQDGNWATIPGGNVGTVTTLSTEVTPVVADSIDFTVADPTSTPKLTIDFKGVAGQYINGEGQLETFPSIPAASEDVKFKIDAADTAEGYWADKVTIGSGLSQSVSTDGSGVKTTTISAVASSTVTSIKVGSNTTFGAFEFAGPGVTMDTTVNPQLITYAGVQALSSTTTGDALDVAVTNDSASTGDSALTFTWAGSSSEYVNGQGDLVTFPTITTYSGWNLAGDTGTAELIASTNTALIAGGVGIATTVSATDTLTIDLEDTAVTPNPYESPDLTVDQQGRITSIVSKPGTLRQYKSYVANFGVSSSNVTVLELENETGLTAVWTMVSGELSVRFSGPLGKGTYINCNGTGGEKAASSQLFYKGVSGGTVVEMFQQRILDGAVVSEDIPLGNLELRIYTV